mgnify:FL=1
MSNGSGTQRRPIPGFGWLPESIQDFEQPLPGAEWLRDQVRPGSVMDPWAEKQARDFLRALVPQNVHDMALEGLVGMIAGPVVGKAGRAVGRKLNPPFDASRRTFGRDTGGGDLLEQVQTRDAMLGDWAEKPLEEGARIPQNWAGAARHGGHHRNTGEIMRQNPEAARVAHSMGRDPTLPVSRMNRRSGLVGKHLDYLKDPWNEGEAWAKGNTATHKFQTQKAEQLSRAIDKSLDSLSTKPQHAGMLEEYFNVLNKRIGKEVLEETGEEVIKGSEGQITKDFLESLLRRFGIRN